MANRKYTSLGADAKRKHSLGVPTEIDQKYSIRETGLTVKMFYAKAKEIAKLKEESK